MIFNRLVYRLKNGFYLLYRGKTDLRGFRFEGMRTDTFLLCSDGHTHTNTFACAVTDRNTLTNTRINKAVHE